MCLCVCYSFPQELLILYNSTKPTISTRLYVCYTFPRELLILFCKIKIFILSHSHDYRNVPKVIFHREEQSINWALPLLKIIEFLPLEDLRKLFSHKQTIFKIFSHPLWLYHHVRKAIFHREEIFTNKKLSTYWQ